MKDVETIVDQDLLNCMFLAANGIILTEASPLS